MLQVSASDLEKQPPLARSQLSETIGTVAEIPGAGEIIFGVGPFCYHQGDAELGRLFPGFNTPRRPLRPFPSSITLLVFISSEKANKARFHFDWIIFGAARFAADRKRAAPAELSAGKT